MVVRFRDLSIPLKVSVVLAYVVGAIYILAFVVGLIASFIQ